MIERVRIISLVMDHQQPLLRNCYPVEAAASCLLHASSVAFSIYEAVINILFVYLSLPTKLTDAPLRRVMPCSEETRPYFCVQVFQSKYWLFKSYLPITVKSF